MSVQDSADAPTRDLDFMRKTLVPAGPVTFRIEPAEEHGRAVALIHVFGAYDCKGTEAEVAGLLKPCKLPWRIVWH